LPAGGSLDPPLLIEWSGIVSSLDPPFFLMVQHSAPDKIKMKQGFRKLSKQDKKDIGTRLDQKNGYRSSLEKTESSGLPNQTVRFSQRKHVLKIFSTIDSRHFRHGKIS
jgi:hypothetical protein